MHSPAMDSENAVFTSFKDRQRARRGYHSVMSTPSRAVNGPHFATPADPTFSSIATAQDGASPSWYDGFDASDWVGGGGGASASRMVPTPARRVTPASASLTSRPQRSTFTTTSQGDSLSPLRARSVTRSPPRHATFAPLPNTTASLEESPSRRPVIHGATRSSRDDMMQRVNSRTQARHREVSVSAPSPATSLRTTKPRRVAVGPRATTQATNNTSMRSDTSAGAFSAHDRRLAQLDRELRAATVVQSSVPASQPHIGAGAPSPLTAALTAHWQSVQSLLDATSPLDGRAPQLVGSEAAQVRKRVENDLLLTLAQLPEKAETVVHEAAEVVPLLLAFGIAAVPTVRTQAIAIGALRALLLSLPPFCGEAETASFVDDVVLEQHHGLEALEAAFVAAVKSTENAHTALAANSGTLPSSSDDPDPLSQMTTANALMVNVLSLLATLASLSGGFCRACLSSPDNELVRRVVQYVPAALPAASVLPNALSAPTTQESVIGAFLLTLCARESAGADVLVAYGAHRAVLDHLRVLFRCLAQVSGGEAAAVLAPPLVQSLSTYLRLLTRLVRGCPHAFRHHYKDTTALLVIMESGLTSVWGTLVESTGMLLVSLLQANPGKDRGGELAERVVHHPALLSRLAGLLVSPQSTRYALTAALVWRWLALVVPTSCAELLSQEAALLTALLQVLLYRDLPSDVETTPQSEVALLLVESTLALCVAVALGSLDARRQLRHVLARQLSEVTRQALRDKLEACVAATGGDYLASLPAIEVQVDLPWRDTAAPRSRAGRPVGAASSTSTRSSTHTTTSATRVLYRSASGRSSRSASTAPASEQGEDSAAVTAAPTACTPRSSTGNVIVNTPALWSRLLLHTVDDLFPSSPGQLARRGDSVTATTVLGHSRPSGGKTRPLALRASMAVAPTLLGGSALPAAQTSDAWRTVIAKPQDTTAVSPSQTVMSLGDATLTDVGGVRARVLGLDTLRYRELPVCLRAQQVTGPHLLQSSIEVVLQLAQSYVDSSAVLPISASAPSPAGARRPSSTSSRGAAVTKESNPWAPPAPTRPQQRRWTIDELEQSDVLLFVVRVDHVVDDLAMAITAVTEHLRYLHRTLQTCPQKAVTRRCLLGDLYRNVYPKMHLFLRYIDGHLGQSRAVLQLLASMEGGLLHSGNVISAYDSISVCVGDQPA